MCGTQEGFPPGLHDKLDQRLKDPSLTRGDCVRMQIESIQLCFPEKCLKPLTSGWAGKTKVSLPPLPPPPHPAHRTDGQTKIRVFDTIKENLKLLTTGILKS